LARKLRQRRHISIWLVKAHDLPGIVSGARHTPGVRIILYEAAHIGDGAVARRIRFDLVQLAGTENLHINVLPEFSRIGIWDG
jgi:hypothetical protein